MPTSIAILLAALGFLVFGYASLVRMLTRQAFPDAGIQRYFKQMMTARLLRNLGSSAFFVSLPATSLLLFWGWGPALLWLLIFHLIVESMCHLQFSSQDKQLDVADHLLRAEKPLPAMLEQGLIQAFFLLSMGVVTALMATLVDRQSGLLFAILFLLPARSLWRHPSPVMPLALRIVGALCLLAAGLAFSDRLGFSVYGDWAPFGTMLDWLRFNNPTVIAAVLVVAVFQLELNQGFKSDLSAFAGLIIVILVILMTVQLVWLAPLLDAPMQSIQVRSTSLPSFAGLSLFIFAGFSGLLIRLLIEEENGTTRGPEHFGRLQLGNLLHLTLLVALVLSLAAAIGIGAWKTHFIEWNDSLNLLDQLNLAITSMLNLINPDAETGTLMHTLLLAALCFTGFSFMLMCANQLTLEEREEQTAISVILEAKVLQAILIFLSSAYFISRGISVDVWLIIGMLGWSLTTHLMMGMTLSQASSGRRKAFSVISLSLAVLGGLQVGAITLSWILASHYFHTTAAIVLLLCVTALWWRPIIAIISGFRTSADEALF
ncbi:hypothetical protein [Arenicella xantha]|uniref:Uncharacterized protein n=1 Tax=Arenicella xantha TaxID=644221 RepID=A0A395JMC3_9GAMM|nr:hypothetical protein [Arenicella xantha]RBP52770.1 hypothetical protein DFR28_101154 [Arenicella xantha]